MSTTKEKKKNRNNDKNNVTSVQAAADADADDDAVADAADDATDDADACYHGGTTEISVYSKVLDDYLAMIHSTPAKNVVQGHDDYIGSDNCNQTATYLEKFYEEYYSYYIDQDFAQYLFALVTNEYLTRNFVDSPAIQKQNHTIRRLILHFGTLNTIS